QRSYQHAASHNKKTIKGKGTPTIKHESSLQFFFFFLSFKVPAVGESDKVSPNDCTVQNNMGGTHAQS
ncbi:unnamed protein product, partial [Prunus brigantina]